MVRCQVCGVRFDGEYIKFDPDKNKDVYKCYECGGLNYFEPIEDDDE